MRRRGRWFRVAVFLLVLLGTACAGSKGEQAEKAPQDAWHTVKPELMEYVQGYTMDKDGNLYVIDYSPEDTEAYLYLRQYDSDGTCLHSQRLSEVNAEGIQTLAFADGKLYYAPKCWRENPSCVLFSCDTASWQEEEVAVLLSIESVMRIIPMGEQIYLLGSDRDSSARRHGGGYQYDGRRLFVLDADAEKLREIPIAEPVDAAAAGEGKLLLYAHTGESFSFLFYDPAENATKTAAVTEECLLSYFGYSPDGGTLIYNCAPRKALLCAPLENPEDTAEIFPEYDYVGYNVTFVDGRVLVRSQNGLVYFMLADVIKESGTIRYVSDSFVSDNPYGCGFTLRREQLSSDKLALKLLAQDEDFDISYINTFRGATGRNLKDNGAFYPLNEVAGVAEYLDSCFPYVREAATDEEGNIWMFPLVVDIPVLVCNTGREEEKTFPFGDQMTHELFFEAQGRLDEEQRKDTELPNLLRNAMQEYFYYHTSADTRELRELLTVQKNGLTLLNHSLPPGTNDYIYSYFPSAEVCLGAISLWEAKQIDVDRYRAYPYPKLVPGGKNIGSCRAIVVNPRSRNLDAVLHYVSALAAYYSSGAQKPLFFQSPSYEDESYRGSLYRIYENGAISFGIEEELYDGYQEVIEGSREMEAYISETEKKLKIYFGE